MLLEGICHKMKATVAINNDATSTAQIGQVQYKLVLDPFECDLMPFLGKTVNLSWAQHIKCISCGAKTNKSYSQGHCYKCFISKASCDLCMMKPETCHFHLGTCREPKWAEHFCFNPHIVYLANSSGLKVGITRYNQMPTRWLDQGAMQAIPILQTQSRFLAGLLEKMFTQTLADKTDWRLMLKQDAEEMDLISIKNHLFEQYAEQIAALQLQYANQIEWLNEDVLHDFKYPILEYPKKVTALNFDKTADITGTLMGIKGQYLLLDTGVLNMRKFSGYALNFSA